MLAANYGTVSDIEILWTIIAVAGLILGVFNLYDAICDWRTLQAVGIANGRRLVAAYGLRNEFARTLMQFIFALIGVLAMFVPEPPPTAHTSTTLISAAIRWGLISSSVILLLKTVDDYITRKTLLGGKH